MKRELLKALVCPTCRGELDLAAPTEGDDVVSGTLRCRHGHDFGIVGGIPRLLGPDATAAGVDQVKDSYSFKWTRLPSFGLDRPSLRRFYDEWFRQKLGLAEEAAFAEYLRSRRAVLDAGTGLGAKVDTVARHNVYALVVGVDISESVVPAYANTRQWPNAHIVQGDIMRLPFREEQFDLIVSDGVLHHTPDTRRAFEALIPFLAAGGDIVIHVYRRLGPLREFCDDLLRRHAMELSPEACWHFSMPFTRLGQALTQLGATIDVPEDVPVLGIKAGRYDLQRFFYLHVFKCFWSEEFDFDENNLVNFDWYHPRYASRHDESEVVGWFEAAGLVDIRVPRVNPNGVSVVGRRR